MTTEDAALSALRTEWPTKEWGWDDRMAVVSSAVSGPHITVARAVVEKAMPQSFDATSIETAPETLRALIAGTGGLRGNQLAFVTGDAYGLWWPWGGGGTVSLRIGLVGASKDEALATRLRDLFAVSLSR
ncbi:MAG: hypothetical protein ABI321_13555 [Polyangia bacterium]